MRMENQPEEWAVSSVGVKEVVSDFNCCHPHNKFGFLFLLVVVGVFFVCLFVLLGETDYA